MFSTTEENYLKALFTAANVDGEVTVNELSKKLEIKMPTVNSMMKKLAEKKLVYYETYKPLKLTEQGKKEAALILRKHRLTEMYLVEKMGFGWEEVHDIAEQIEHLSSPAFFKKMDELLGYPKFDPHGSPIPDGSGKMKWLHYRKLSECKPGETVTLSAVTNSSDEFLKFLNSYGLQLGTELVIKAVEAFDGTMTINFGRKKSKSLSRVAAEKILVKETAGNS